MMLSGVLNVASEYMRLGMYAQALDVLLARLSRVGLPIKANRDNSLRIDIHWSPIIGDIAGRNGSTEPRRFQCGGELSSSYVFPSRAEELEISRAALKGNLQDAAHTIFSEHLLF